VHSDTAEPVRPSAEETAARARHSDRILEVAAVILLGGGTLLAAWSGYQSAIWNGIQASDYVTGSGLRVESAKASTLAGQEKLYDSQVLGEWLDANAHGDTKLAAVYERRFRPEFRVAFQAWMATDPFNNPNSPPGPLFMKEYVQATAQRSDDLEVQAAATIQAGQDANDVSDSYVLDTVVFATVLFLAAISDRFDWIKARIAVLGMAGAVLLFGAVSLLRLPIS
jgi:hypothetical protein